MHEIDGCSFAGEKFILPETLLGKGDFENEKMEQQRTLVRKVRAECSLLQLASQIYF